MQEKPFPELTVSNFEDAIPLLINYLNYRIARFSAGGIRDRLSAWENRPSDFETLTTVKGLPLECEQEPFVDKTSNQKRMSEKEEAFLCREINSLLRKNISAKCSSEPGEYFSPIFLVPKEDDSYRLILNLKSLNKCMPYQHFKLDTIHTVTSLIQTDCYMASIDIKDAYYSVPILAAHQKYVKVEFDGVYYKCMALPNGLCSGPRKCTKLRPPLLYCIRQGILW